MTTKRKLGLKDFKFLSSHTTLECARHYGVSKKTIQTWRSVHEYELDNCVEPGDIEKFNNLSTQDIVYLKNYPIRDCMNKFDVCRDTIGRWRRILGISPMVSGSTFNNFTNADKEYLLTHTRPECAEHWGVSIATVSNWRKKLKYDGSSHKALSLSDDEVKFITEQSARKSSETFGVSVYTIYRWRVELGVTKSIPDYIRAMEEYTEFEYRILHMYRTTVAATLLGVPDKFIPKMRRELNIKQIGIGLDSFDEEDIAFIKSHGLYESAREYHVNARTIRRWCDRLNINWNDNIPNDRQLVYTEHTYSVNTIHALIETARDHRLGALLIANKSVWDKLNMDIDWTKSGHIQFDYRIGNIKINGRSQGRAVSTEMIKTNELRMIYTKDNDDADKITYSVV